MNGTASACALPRGELLPQEEVQARLVIEHARAGDLDATLRNLGDWLGSVGYFDHLKEENERLEFPDAELAVTLRLQVNYSRLAYRSPAADRRVACPLCIDNIGTPGKELLRVFQFELGGRPFFAHPTPFPLCPGHFVVNSLEHRPMAINAEGLEQSADFVERAKGWLVASNSDVEWAGASVLGHHHMQVFESLRLPLEDAAVRDVVAGGDYTAEFLRWPLPVVRLSGNRGAVLAAAARLVAAWKETDPGKATFNYLMRGAGGGSIQVHLLFRHPSHRTGEVLRPIKAEGVGIIEVAGEIIVPPLAGKTREENRRFFEAEGHRVVRGIISQNAPVDNGRPLEWFSRFSAGILCQGGVNKSA